MQYSIKLGQQQEEVLQINGKQSICPFAAPIPFAGNMGQIQIMRMPCSTICPHAKIEGSYYTMTCGKGSVDLLLTNEQKSTEPPSNPSLIVKM